MEIIPTSPNIFENEITVTQHLLIIEALIIISSLNIQIVILVMYTIQVVCET